MPCQTTADAALCGLCQLSADCDVTFLQCFKIEISDNRTCLPAGLLLCKLLMKNKYINVFVFVFFKSKQAQI